MRPIRVLFAQLLKNALLFPEAQHLALYAGEIGHSWHWFVQVRRHSFVQL
jgi:hypothetical protein